MTAPSSNLGLPRQVSKKQHIYETLRSRIQERLLPVGTRLPNTADLAKEWCVAHATAHAALAELTRDGWVVRYPKHGTFVSMPPEKVDTDSVASNTAVLVLPARDEITASGNSAEVFDIVQGLSESARDQGWQLRIESLPNVLAEEDVVRAVESIQKAAISIFIGSQYETLIKKLRVLKFPTVTLGHDPGCGDVVNYDRHVSITEGVRYLVGRGCSRIGFFGNTEEPNGKYEIYRRVMQELGLPIEESRNGHYSQITLAGKTVESYLANLPACDGIFFANYRIASAFAREALRRGIRIPGDISIVAQGIKVAEIDSVPIAYVRLPYIEYGREAIRIVSSKSGDKKTGVKRTTVILKPRLIEE